MVMKMTDDDTRYPQEFYEYVLAHPHEFRAKDDTATKYKYFLAFTQKKSAVKKYFSENKMRVGSEVYEKLNDNVEKIFSKALERAKKNKRTTILEQDL